MGKRGAWIAVRFPNRATNAVASGPIGIVGAGWNMMTSQTLMLRSAFYTLVRMLCIALQTQDEMSELVARPRSGAYTKSGPDTEDGMIGAEGREARAACDTELKGWESKKRREKPNNRVCIR